MRWKPSVLLGAEVISASVLRGGNMCKTTQPTTVHPVRLCTKFTPARKNSSNLLTDLFSQANLQEEG